MAYTIRFSTRESGWINIATVDSLKAAREELERQLQHDEKENDTTNITQIIDDSGKVITEYEGKDY